jgi:hypothetical protein
VNVFGSAITLAAPVIYIGTAISPPIPSILTFACGAINGFTGAWDLTTAAFQLNAASIQLNSLLSVAINNNTTVAGSSSIYTSGVLNVTNSSTSQATIASFMTPNLPSGFQSVLTFGKSASAFESTEFNYIYNTTNSLISTSWGFYGGTGSRISLKPNDINLTSAITNINGILNVINGNIFTNQNIIGGLEIINNGNLSLNAASPGLILIRGGSGSIITVPDATTLIVGYTYTINNNSNHTATVNYHNSGTIGTVPSLNAATVTCIATNSVNGQWDIHITGPTTGTDWATPGQIGSAVPNTGAFTTLTATSTIKANSTNLANNSTLNPGLFVYSDIVNSYGMDLGYNPTSARYRTRIFCPDNGNADLSLSSRVASASTQSGFTDYLVIDGANGETSLFGKTFIVSSSPSTTTAAFNVNNTNTNPGFLSLNLAPSLGTNNTIYYGLGKSIAAFDMAVLGFLSNGTSSKATVTIVGSSTSIDQTYNGNINLTAPTTVVSNDLTAGNTTITGTSSTLNSGVLNVNNTATVIASNIASFLQPTLGNIDVLQEDLNLTFGKSNTTNNSAQLQFGYTSASPPFSNPFTTWGFYGLSGTSIQLRQNPSVTQDNVLISGTTKIDGNLKVSGTIQTKNSSALYVSNAVFSVLSDIWTDAQALVLSRSSGTNLLTMLVFSGLDFGFSNSTGLTLQVSVSFSCQQVAAGFTSLRIAFNNATGLIAQEDIESTNPQYGNVAANFNLAPGESIRCLIRPVLGIPNIPFSFQGVAISINTTPIV